jgi:hypothetical protein
MTIIAEVKSVVSAHKKAFARAVVNYNWHVKAAHYLAGATAVFKRPARHVFIAIEKTAPYAVACYTLDDEALNRGEEIRAGLMDTLADCIANDIYPGYDDGVQQISLPPWAFND